MAFSIYSGAAIVLLSSSSATTMTVTSAYALPGPQTIKVRNLVIDLGNGVKTDAQLTLPMLGKGPFPGVLLVHGSGAVDMNEQIGKISARFWQIAQYLSERGFAVLRYDKRGVGPNLTISNSNVWGNTTFTNLKQDAQKALAVLIKQPEVDPNRITVIGHSEGTTIVPRIAIENATKVKNIVLMGAVANNTRDLTYLQTVTTPVLYAQRVLDRDYNGLLSLSEAGKNPVFNTLVGNLTLLLETPTSTGNGTTKYQLNPAYNTNKDTYISINNELKPKLVAQFNSLTVVTPGKKCTEISGCPIWLKSQYALEPNLNIIGNIPHSTSVLIQQGQNDSQTPIQQAFLLQQALIAARHPDNTLITYPNLGHAFYPSSEWKTILGPIQQYVLADLYSWLAAHSGFTVPAGSSATTSTNSTTSTMASFLSSNSTASR